MGSCPPDYCITALGQSGSENLLVHFIQLSPTEMLVGYAFYQSGPIPPSRAFTQILLPLLFTGPVDAPTFLTGTFDGLYETDIPFLPPYPGTLTIEPLTNSTVPEPSSFALMATGILGAITILRHRRSRTS
ncbi:PEP-CTERM sorting domain-containing protein [Tunturiibacter empetritectus]|uniref:PEP-CTERM sorting domain-containing protein n=1 Tax=Tunturiibacter empetritectus TaxID=3069691 RepID=UPI003D9B97CD